MKIIVKAIALLLLVSFLRVELSGQSTSIIDKTTWSIETDPSTFVFNGYAFHFRIKPQSSQHLVVGAGTYALDLPSAMVNLNADNKNQGWKVRIRSAYALFGEYYFAEANQKWFAGLQIGIQNYRNEKNEVANEQLKYSNLLVMPSLGYNWSPFKFPLYLKPWFGVGYTSKVSGENAVGNLNYHIASFTPFATLHMGYTFK